MPVQAAAKSGSHRATARCPERIRPISRGTWWRCLARPSPPPLQQASF